MPAWSGCAPTWPSSPGGPLPELCDELLERLVDGRPDDDVALVAVRLHGHDSPQPEGAEPARP